MSCILGLTGFYNAGMGLLFLVLNTYEVAGGNGMDDAGKQSAIVPQIFGSGLLSKDVAIHTGTPYENRKYRGIALELRTVVL